MHSQTVEKPVRVAVFSQVTRADQAVRKLLEAGFDRDELAVVTSDENKERFFQDLATPEQGASYTPQAIATGGAIGASIGGLALAATALATGGVGLLAAGTVLIGGGAIAGSFTGAMATRGFQKEYVDYYDQAVRLGKILVAVEVHGEDAPRRLALAERLFEECGADPVPLVEG